MIIGIDNANNPKRNWGKRKFTPQYAPGYLVILNVQRNPISKVMIFLYY